MPPPTVTDKDLARRRNLLLGAMLSPFVLALIPFVIFLAITLILTGTPAFALSSFLIGVIFTILGFFIGIGFSVYFLIKRRRLTRALKERIAVRGIPAEDVEWFRDEMRPAERRALAALKNADPILEDAYRETLASRLTASRILRSVRSELAAVRRRENRLKQIHPGGLTERHLAEIGKDRKKIEEIQTEARELLSEAEIRLQMIEAAAARGGNLSDMQIALEKLAGRAGNLPLALEAARITEETADEIARLSGGEVDERLPGQ